MSSILLGNQHLLNLKNPDITYDDVPAIARSLSRIPRFCGHTKDFYSVAQHSIEVSLRVLELSHDWHKAKEALFHEITEACGLGDVASPVKSMLGKQARKKIEEFEGNLLKGLDISYPFCEEVHQADREVLIAEAKEKMAGDLDYILTAFPDVGIIRLNYLSSLPEETCYRLFMAMYRIIEERIS